jgi:ribosomal protein L7/L12
MNTIVKQLLTKISEAGNIEAAKAYAESALMIVEAEGLVEPRLTGAGERKIDAIKEIRNFSKEMGWETWGLKETKEFVEAVPRAFPKMSIQAAKKLQAVLVPTGYTVEF